MSLFKKKSSNDGIPEIPTLPDLPSFGSSATKPNIDLPATSGDARDANNQEAIKSAIYSSEKIGGDSGAAINSPSENFTIPPISSVPVNSQQTNMTQDPTILPVFTQAPAQTKPLPEPPRYEKKQAVFSSTFPEPPIKEQPLMNPFVQPEPTQIQESKFQVEEKTVKRDAADSIFVRIDKFNSAKRDVEEIGRDLKEITQVIEKITDIKIKEDEEITEINKTLEEIKNRINRIDLDVFNRI